MGVVTAEKQIIFDWDDACIAYKLGDTLSNIAQQENMSLISLRFNDHRAHTSTPFPNGPQEPAPFKGEIHGLSSVQKADLGERPRMN